jgi:hypothetical protein
VVDVKEATKRKRGRRFRNYPRRIVLNDRFKPPRYCSRLRIRFSDSRVSVVMRRMLAPDALGSGNLLPPTDVSRAVVQRERKVEVKKKEISVRRLQRYIQRAFYSCAWTAHCGCACRGMRFTPRDHYSNSHDRRCALVRWKAACMRQPVCVLCLWQVVSYEDIVEGMFIRGTCIVFVYPDDSVICTNKSRVLAYLRGPHWPAPPFPPFNVLGGVVLAPQQCK